MLGILVILDGPRGLLILHQGTVRKERQAKKKHKG